MGHERLEDTTIYLHLSQRHLHAEPARSVHASHCAGGSARMSRPPFEVADVVRKAGSRFRERCLA